MWILRRPRKVLLIALTGIFIWTSISYLFSKTSVNIVHRSIKENSDLTEYDEIVEENVAVTKSPERVKFVNKFSYNEEKSKFDEAVDREEKNNLLKHNRLNQDLEDIESLQEISAKQNGVFDHRQPVINELSKHGTKNVHHEIVFVQDKHELSTVGQSAEGKLTYEDSIKYGHNESVSQMISLSRPLPDIRDPVCQNIKYPENLPDVSVVIVFYNEAWTTLLRTVHSVINRSPPHLIHEIILIDDFSDYEHLKVQLKDYLVLLPKVVLRRTTSRVGVVTSRQLGASVATGSVLLFLDSHCECTTGWLEPLLDRIRENETHVVTPVMDIIDDQTFDYKSFDAKSINIGGFDWNLQFVWIGIPERVRKLLKSEIDFVRSPTMPGGMFAISRNYFNKLGGYDPGMNMWGAENLEMSFKIWMCGGSLETVPCSHVGHVFRSGTSYKLDNGDVQKNYFRLAEVWLDEYKELYYQKTKKPVELSEDIISRKALRKRLNCQTFGWYLKNVYPELFIPSEAVAFGEIRNKEEAFADGTRFPACLDASGGVNAALVKIWPCHNQGGNQLWMLSKFGEIRRDDRCMDYSGEKVVILSCHGQQGNQAWRYNLDGAIQHVNSKLCMELSKDGGTLTMSLCSGKKNQIWLWERQSNDIQPQKENKVVQELAVDSY